MMNYVKTHTRVSLSVLALGIVLIFSAIASNAPAPSSLVGKPSYATIPVTSSFSKTTLAVAASTGLQGDPNSAAVNGQYEFFPLGAGVIPDDLSYDIHEDVPALLAQIAQPTSPHSYLQIDLSTVNCVNNYDCSFSFYLDSPESYYHYRRYLKPDGSNASELIQQPFPGALK